MKTNTSPLGSKLILLAGIVLMLATYPASAQRNQQSRFGKAFSETVLKIHSPGFDKNSSAPQLKLTIPFKQIKMVFRINGSFRIRKEYWSASDVVQHKSISLTILPSSISRKPKYKSI